MSVMPNAVTSTSVELSMLGTIDNFADEDVKSTTKMIPSLEDSMITYFAIDKGGIDILTDEDFDYVADIRRMIVDPVSYNGVFTEELEKVKDSNPTFYMVVKAVYAQNVESMKRLNEDLLTHISERYN
ncbi:MAG: hypothetical protein KKF89_04240 [Nanoarchaeota archaeon]|nr:hypothetical protein [Nanoarchaeota archaeon]MBU1854905.1 hypothetical protein [Nanoarchaeota archaeon]